MVNARNRPDCTGNHTGDAGAGASAIVDAPVAEFSRCGIGWTISSRYRHGHPCTTLSCSYGNRVPVPFVATGSVLCYPARLDRPGTICDCGHHERSEEV